MNYSVDWDGPGESDEFDDAGLCFADYAGDDCKLQMLCHKPHSQAHVVLRMDGEPYIRMTPTEACRLASALIERAGVCDSMMGMIKCARGEVPI